MVPGDAFMVSDRFVINQGALREVRSGHHHAAGALAVRSASHYVTGTPDGKRPGRVVVATSNFAERSLIDDEAVAYHEGVPGHHMQLSVQQQLSGLPKFRLHGLGFNAYSEGWALYAERSEERRVGK